MSDRLRFAAPVGQLAQKSTREGIGFRQDIEGLRGICVSAVVLFHAFPAWVPGGFVGVDVFFVISGFLISTILYREFAETGRIDLANFYARRITRILPASTLVLCGIAVMSCLTQTLETRSVGKHIIAAALFYYNWRQAADAVDYLAADHRDNPVLHYWSLSVEEQFYLVWPLLLAGVLLWTVHAKKLRAGAWLAGLAAVLWTVSFAENVHLTSTSGPYAFFGTVSRSWQLLSGALIAALLAYTIPRRSALLDLLGLGCILALAACFLAMPSSVDYPGVFALVPTGAAALLIYLNGYQGAWAVSFLSATPLRYLGRISFSWYLWHWPLLVFGKSLLGPAVIWQWAMIGASLCAAAATYRWVENPIRHSMFLRARPRATFATGAMLIALAAGAGLALKSFGPDGVAIGNGAFVSAQAVKSDKPVIYRDDCLLGFDAIEYGACQYGSSSGTKTVVLFGDSHAGNWFSPLNEAAQETDWKLLVRIKASCRPVDAPQSLASGRDYRECTEWREAVLREIEKLRPNLVVVTSMGAGFSPEVEQRVIARLAAAGPVVIVRDTPTLPEAPIACLRRTGDPAACKWPMAERISAGGYPRSAADQLPGNVTILDLNSHVCPDQECQAVVGKVVTMFDKHHLTDSYSRTFIRAFADLLTAR